MKRSYSAYRRKQMKNIETITESKRERKKYRAGRKVERQGERESGTEREGVVLNSLWDREPAEIETDE